ncbi:spidroin-2-like [Melitaea cinxia]|uniref:spidroin-2-like n=1 Tax=Melitaea cinxia TaxID=113334 RepID=UPI001E2714FB|nr:spidroin-2-like [Melitaea cinxia]
MKLLVILSVIAIGYADKLDRTYLPPSNAASAGGSPGALTAPAIQSGSSFGKVVSSGSGSTPGPAGFTQSPLVFSQGSAGIAQGASGFGQGPSGVAQGVSGFGQGPLTIQEPSGFIGQKPSAYGQGPSGFSQGSSVFGQGPSAVSQGSFGFGQGPSNSEQPLSGLDLSNKVLPSGSGFVSTKTGATPGSSYDAAFETRIPSAPLDFGSPQLEANQAGVTQLANGPFTQGFGQGSFGPNGPQAYTPERAQASADRSATILNYYNENNGDSYKYSYETSNGISAGEEGVATNGVRAQGGYSYTGDDGVSYSVTYTADENGFQPQGDHLPTPHPIPEEILKSIEENARAAAAGTQEGAYRPEEYESDEPLRQYNAGATNFNQPQGPNVGAVQGPQSAQNLFNRPESNQFPGSLDQFTQKRPIGISGQYGPQSAGSFGQFNEKSSAGLSQTIQGQDQGTNGYNYKQPQSNFESTGLGQRPSSQFRPQANAQEQKDFSLNIGSSKSGSNNQGSAPVANGITSVSPLGGWQTQYQTGLSQSADTGSTSSQGQQSSFGSSQGSQYRPGSTPFGPIGTPGQGNQYQLNTNQNAFGVNRANQDNQNGGLIIGQDNQNQYGNKLSSDSIVGIPKTSPTYNQNTQSSSAFGRGTQQNGNQALGSKVGSNQGVSQFGAGNQAFGSSVTTSAGVRDSQPIQAPYQYNRPSQGFDSQPQRPGFNGPQSPTPVSQGIQRVPEQFGGPRQPPSFSPEQGYKY